VKRAVALVSLAALLGSGCGARWSHDEEKVMAARYAQGGSGGAGASGAARTSTGATGNATPGAVTGATGSGGDGTTGGGGSASGAGATSGGTASGPLPCGSHSDAVGVTDTEVTVGTLNSLSGPVPGLGSSYLAATQAYVAYRNSIGGVCGRHITLKSADDGGDSATNRAEVSDLNKSSVALLAGVAGGGDGGAEVIDAERIPIVGTSISPKLDQSPTYYAVRPPLADYHVPTPKYQYLYDQGVRKAALVYVSAASAPKEAEQVQRPLMEAVGIQVVLDTALPLSTLSYDSTARAVANSGADYLFFIYTAEASAAMAQSMADTGYKLKYSEYIVAYGSSFIQLGGKAAEGATNWLFTLPNEDAGAVAEQAAFLQWMGQIAPDSVVDPFAASAWSGAKLLFDTLEALPGAITRDALLAQLANTGTYDAGGLVAPVQLGARVSRGCQIGMIVENGAWRRLTPAQGFLC
jgi:ABC-type branched-subunit amino acid transport system substrate-binding protein